jgi:hypothetical protein
MNVGAPGFAYVFSTAGTDLVKIGSTADPQGRLIQLRWGNPRPVYVPDNVHLGDYAILLPVASIGVARSVERMCQAMLGEFRVPHRTRGGGLPEWFRMGADEAAEALMEAHARVHLLSPAAA